MSGCLEKVVSAGHLDRAVVRTCAVSAPGETT